MSGLITIFAGLMRTLFIRLPLGIWLAVLFATGWLLLERHFAPDFPVFPCTTNWPPEFVNPSYPENPSEMTLLDPLIKQISALNLGISETELTFGRVEYGAFLGALFGLALCWPCGIWTTIRRYSGVLAFPFRVILLGMSYAAIGGGVGYLLAQLFGANLISTGYVAVFGLLMPIVVPLPYWILRPFFPSAARRQAKLLFKQARRESITTLADIAKLDPALKNITKGKQQKEWDYYATVSGLFLGLLLGEKRGAPAYQRAKVEKLLRRKLNKQYDKGEPGLTAVSQFCKEYLEKGTKFTTEILVGLWLAMQMKGGDLNPARDKDLATSLGGHIVQGMNRMWPVRSRLEGVFSSIVLWAGVAGLAFLALNPRQLEGQIAWLDSQIHQRPEAAEPTKDQELGELPTSKDAADSSTTSDATDSQKPDKTLAEPATDEQNEESLPTQTVGSTVATRENLPANLQSPNAYEAEEKLIATNSDVTPDETTTKPATELNTDSESSDSSEVAKTTPEPEPSAKITPPIREWTHQSGRKLQASAVSYRDGSVELLREDGRSAFINLKDLSEEDRQVVYSHFAGKNAENASPAELNPGELLIHSWTAPNSSKQVTAAILGISTDAVELMLADGRILSIPIEQLSKADQDYLKALTAKAE